jgi:hypothetical protein
MPPILSETDEERLRQNVMRQCNMTLEGEESSRGETEAEELI